MTTSRTVDSTDHPGVTVPTAIRAWSRWRWVRPSRWVLASIVLAGANSALRIKGMKLDRRASCRERV